MRPLLEKSAAQLDAIAERNRDNRAELGLVLGELRYRTSPGARRIRKKVESYLTLLEDIRARHSCG